MNTQMVEVVRAFYFARKLQEVGAKVEVPMVLAQELRAAKKAIYVTPQTPKPVADQKPTAATDKK